MLTNFFIFNNLFLYKSFGELMLQVSLLKVAI